MASNGNGIRGNDAVIVSGGVINVNITGTACKGISTDGEIKIDGGRTTVTTSGTYTWDSDDNDYSACAGFKADSLVTINSGTVLLKSTGIGGKGIKCDNNMVVNGGKIAIITSGASYPTNTENAQYSTSPKAIKADGNLTINGGYIKVRSAHSEGIESKGMITINDGVIESYCYDDAINSKYDLKINGGFIYAHATNNDAIDANRNLYINAGVVIAEGAAGAENGLDAAEGYNIYINGGTIVATGGSTAQTAGNSKQASVATSASSGTTYALYNSTTALLVYQMPTSGGSALMISSPSLNSGSSYSLVKGVKYSGGSSFYSLTTGAATSGGSNASSLSAAYQVGNGALGGGKGKIW